ncbi:hypothetical protein [Pseudomonas sp. CP4]|uniref:hypothetical protein n=1 Tax=Pseudomonas sp. CP4 TaxID=3388844 RepID=UPI0039EFF214
MAQHDISNIITHELMKGEIREDFLLETLRACSDPAPVIVKGTVSDGTTDAGQLDLILLKPYSHPRKLGTQCFVEKRDALCIIEVKGNCTGKDLRLAEKKAQVIQQLNGANKPLYGVVCYRAMLEEKTILNRFGFQYDRETFTYFDNSLIPHEQEADWQTIHYPNLDFFVCFEDEKKTFLRKYNSAPGIYRFHRSVEYPLIKNLFSMIRSLWEQSNKTST